MNDDSVENVRQATRLLAEASTDESNYLVMTTADLHELLSAGGLEKSRVAEITRVAHSEFNAPKLAHLDANWSQLRSDGPPLSQS